MTTDDLIFEAFRDLAEAHPEGVALADIDRALRSDDIESRTTSSERSALTTGRCVAVRSDARAVALSSVAVGGCGCPSTPSPPPSF